MNQKIKELAEQAGICPSIQNIEVWIAQGYELELFADLVRRDERVNVYNTLISGDFDAKTKASIGKILEQSK